MRMGTSATKRLLQRLRLRPLEEKETERERLLHAAEFKARGIDRIEEDESGAYLALPARDSLEPPQPVYRPKASAS